MRALVRAELCPRHYSRVSGEPDQNLARGNVPDTGCLVCRRRDDACSVRAELSARGDGHEIGRTRLSQDTDGQRSVSPDGTRIVTASADKTACVWDVAMAPDSVRLAGHTGVVVEAEFSPDGARIVTGSWDDTARVWDPATGKTLATLTGHDKPLQSAHFSPDARRIVTASDDKTACVWDAATGKMLRRSGHEPKY